ncbi:unnamed protein product (macronuclear) [Paramecium tetraurelia]|uniref:Uncharacterized protein n=1 Tax=Paramecium tetraurelia TaxID=5888 RepID=A0BKI5_PARTE|nr:uncharacterized protein GSPATT00029683001 [Paramecium tetraurelia]CAK59052.1 unnamed protein product [Paramecium tetraurelia]|eukprot:XP_001426450.1 hypothetical protein (macronuclear) [Paramecium tetraurelia strain d4-2]
MSNRNKSLTERKNSKSKCKTAISQRKNSDSEDYNFYQEFQLFYPQAQGIKFTKFEYMKEFFNLGISEFPSDQEIQRIQQEILTTSGWNSNLKKNWTLNEKKVLIWLVGKLSIMRNEDIRDLSAELFEEISRMICRRDKDQCKQKWSQMQKIALQQQPFKPEEDKKLYEIILQYQSVDMGQKWSQIAQELNQHTSIYRSSKQCRERWLNHLNPKISKQPWTDEEDILLLNHVKDQGRRWAEISKIMDGKRSENNLKNRFNSLIKREKDLPVMQGRYQTCYSQTQNGSATHLDDLLSGCTGPEITDLQRQAIDVLLSKLKWRSAEGQNKNTRKKSIELNENVDDQVKRQFQQRAQITTPYTVGNIESESNIMDLTPCLVNVSKNIIYFCTQDTFIQYLGYHQQQQQQYKDKFDKIKSELYAFDVGFQNFKSTLSMIEEIDEPLKSLSYFQPNDLDGFLNLETPETVSKPLYVNSLDMITHSAIKYLQRWKTECQFNDGRRSSITIPRSLPNLIQIQQ